ncbi:MBL fold metallo-hydrolase [Paenibacillus sp. P46E]|uniref:MBL fold metallo-hydrolase n=1 Tax=Paenibacillus sp. P46E TaxID=1349436 RepID=UPI0009400E1B|nr:MBL fold metallo-hydrolase [Paenibacillus sp. P46E]OKP96826.1 MBL fold metallo-hydrolase [Paenibacillus sp. P46E]
MTIDLQMLGTGDAFSTKYYNNNALLQVNGYTLLIDCGVTAPKAMKALGKSFREVNETLITHIHGDHIGGLENLAHTINREPHGGKMTLLLAETLIEPLWRHPLLHTLHEEGNRSLSDIFDIKPLEAGISYPLAPSLTVELIRTPHIPGKDSYSLLLNEKVFYSADLTFQPELLLSLVRERGIARILHDCQLRGHGQVHTTLKELMSLPEEVGKLILLMHYSDEKPGFEGQTGEMEFLEQHRIYSL